MRYKIIDNLFYIIRLMLAVFLLAFLFYDRSFIKVFLFGTGVIHKEFFTVFSVLFISCFLLYVIIAFIIRKYSTPVVCIIIFIMAILPRFILMIEQLYIPTSDFKNYFSFGQNIYYKRFDLVASIINSYQMPKMCGLALLNGLIAYIFSPSLNGLITANILMTSSICVILFLLLKNTNKTAGILTGALYAIYPTSIISSQITTNHHGALLFMLIAVYVYQRSLVYINKKRYWIYVPLSALCIVISNFFHQSVIILLISLFIYLLANIIANKESRLNIVKMILSFVVIICIFIYGSDAVVKLCYKHGIIKSQDEISILFKFAMGTDIDSNGSYNDKYGSYEYKSMSSENQRYAYWEAIKENFKKVDIKQLLSLFANKTHTAWFKLDSYIALWYRNAQSNDYAEIINEGSLTHEMALIINKEGFAINEAAHVDMLYIHWIYLFAAIALITKRKMPLNSSINILLFVSIGWIIYIALTEMQTRYRYIAMPAFFILGAIGIVEVAVGIKKKFRSLRSSN